MAKLLDPFGRPIMPLWDSGSFSSISYGNSENGQSRQEIQQYSRFERYTAARRIDISTPLINAALNIRAGNSTIPNRSNVKALQIHSKNEKVLEILTDCNARVQFDTKAYNIMRGVLQYGDLAYILLKDGRLISGMRMVERPDFIKSKVYNTETYMLEGYRISGSKWMNFGPSADLFSWDSIVHFSDECDMPFGKGALWSIPGSELDYRFARVAMVLARILRGEDRNIIPADISRCLTNKEVKKTLDNALSQVKYRRFVDSNGRLISSRHPLSASTDIAVGIRPDMGQFEAKMNKVPAQSSLDQIEDILFLRDEMLAPLGVPKRYLNQDKDITAKASLDRQDIQMLRLCIMDQQHLIRGIRFVFDLQLSMLGYDPNDVNNDYSASIIDLSLEDEKVFWEIEKTKADIFNILGNTEAMDIDTLRQKLWDFTPEKLKKIEGSLKDMFSASTDAAKALQVARAIKTEEEVRALGIMKSMVTETIRQKQEME